MSAIEIRAAMDQAKTVETEPPRPLMRPVGVPEAFPIQAMEGVLKGAADGIVDIVQVPDAMACQSVLAAATLATQGLANVELPTGQRRPLSGFFITVAGSGERKSASDGLASDPVRDHEECLRQQYEADRIDYELTKDAYDGDRRRAVNIDKKEERSNRIEALGCPPAPPQEPTMICTEPTIEGLYRLLAEGQPTIGLFSSEGGQFIAGHGMADDNRLKTAAALSSLWDGEPVRRVRHGDGTTTLFGRRLSMHLMAQPDAAARWLADPVLADQGLLSRLLTVAPASLAGSRAWHDPDPASRAALNLYNARLGAIFQRPLPMKEGAKEGLSPRVLSLSPDARKAWTAFYNMIERQLLPDGELRPIMGLANKLPECATRLAAVLTLVDDVEASILSLDHLERGIALAEHYASEALRLHGTARINPDLQAAARLLTWLRDKWTEPLVSVVECYHLGPRALRSKRQSEKMLAILEDHGWITRLETNAYIKGKKRQQVWRIYGKEAA